MNDENRSLPDFALSEAEQVLRHQLNILDYWANRSATGAESQPAKDVETAAALVPPDDRWMLTRNLSLREWQLDCCQAWFEAGKRGVVKVVTGAGKTILALAIMERLQGEVAAELRVAISVPTVVLQQQWYDLITGPAGMSASLVGRLGGGYQESFDGGVRILICVLNSASAKLPKLAEKLNQPLLLVVDECHRAGATQMSEIFATRRDFNLGLSATPERNVSPEEEDAPADGDSDDEQEESFDESLLGQQLGPIIFELDYRQAIAEGILARFTIEHYGLPLEPAERTRYEGMSREISELRRYLQSQVAGRSMDGGALVGWARKVAARGGSDLASQAAKYVSLTGQRKQLVYRAQARAGAVNQLLAKAFAENPDSRVLLFHESIGEVMRLFALLKGSGFAVVVEHSQLPESLRRESLHLFRIGTAKVMVSARSLIEGFDVPAADMGIVVASSSSVRQRVQTLGRILRKKPGEDRAAKLVILYMSETTDEMIYEKQDWAAITGAERNKYFTWDPTLETSQPFEKEGPPRRPKPGEDAIQWDALKEGDSYPGAYEGMELTCDAQGNVRNAEGQLCSNPQGLPEIVFRLRQNFGKFRVSPQKRAIIVASSETGQLLFGGFLPETLAFAESPKSANKKSDFTELFIRSKAGGNRIARKFKGGEAFARTPGQAKDPAKGADCALLMDAINALTKAKGRQIRKFKLSPTGEAFAEVDGEEVLVATIHNGLEFPEIP